MKLSTQTILRSMYCESLNWYSAEPSGLLILNVEVPRNSAIVSHFVPIKLHLSKTFVVNNSRKPFLPKLSFAQYDLQLLRRLTHSLISTYWFSCLLLEELFLLLHASIKISPPNIKLLLISCFYEFRHIFPGLNVCFYRQKKETVTFLTNCQIEKSTIILRPQKIIVGCLTTY